MAGRPVVFWDFDGTLAYRPGMWSGSLEEALLQVAPGSDIRADHIAPYLSQGFPWHTPEQSHTHLTSREAWWANLLPTLRDALISAGARKSIADEASRLLPAIYLNPARWSLFDDAEPALDLLTRLGWRHVIVSNHVPELSELVRALPLSGYVDACVSSGVVGYEKPHPEIFEAARTAAGSPEVVVMVGDNYQADVAGPRALGIPALHLDRTQRGTAGAHLSLHAVASRIAEAPRTQRNRAWLARMSPFMV